ncbi:hypothetical protein ACLB2K_075669 [Fragaria x ananassa]
MYRILNLAIFDPSTGVAFLLNFSWASSPSYRYVTGSKGLEVLRFRPPFLLSLRHGETHFCKGALNLEERRGRKGYKEFAAPKSGFKRFSLLSWNTFTVRLPSVHLQVSNLREPSPDLKMGSMSRLKGTTLVAFFFERFNGKEIVTGIMLGADSRLSNKKRFLDIGKKIFRIGKNILILMAGNGDDCEKMCAHLTGKLNNPVEVGSLKVGDVLDMVVTYLNANLDVDGDNSNIGSLVAGWDEKEGLLVYWTKLKDQWVHWEGEHNYVSVGNGREHALHFLGKYYERKMSPENVAELALGALYTTTNDPFTGGPLQDDLKYYFRYVSNGNIKAASCITKIGDLHFYRVVCKSADVVSVIYDFIGGSQHKPHSLEENFPHGIYLESEVPVYVQPSLEGLQTLIILHIRNKFHAENFLPENEVCAGNL